MVVEILSIEATFFFQGRLFYLYQKRDIPIEKRSNRITSIYRMGGKN